MILDKPSKRFCWISFAKVKVKERHQRSNKFSLSLRANNNLINQPELCNASAKKVKPLRRFAWAVRMFVIANNQTDECGAFRRMERLDY